jgi:vacuolar-type H+-ATPase subunit H
VRDLLYRFRPAGAPGPASAAAVPADRAADREGELAPVLDLLAETEEQCAALREDSVRGAEGRHEQARSAAHRVVAEAESRAPGERADAAAGVAAQAAGERAATVAEAHDEADRLLVLAAQRTPAWVERVVAEVEQLLGAVAEGGRR